MILADLILFKVDAIILAVYAPAQLGAAGAHQIALTVVFATPTLLAAASSRVQHLLLSAQDLVLGLERQPVDIACLIDDKLLDAVILGVVEAVLAFTLGAALSVVLEALAVELETFRILASAFELLSFVELLLDVQVFLSQVVKFSWPFLFSFRLLGFLVEYLHIEYYWQQHHFQFLALFSHFDSSLFWIYLQFSDGLVELKLHLLVGVLLIIF